MTMLASKLGLVARPELTSWTCGQCQRRLQGRSYSFQHGDSVLLNNSKDPSKSSFFVQKLDASKHVHGHVGKIAHQDIIGRSPRDTVTSSKNVWFRLVRPTLDDYVRLTPRLVTPIYPADANLIVSLLDLHADPTSDERIEILEAGTGHGGLTLHLARAIHAANHDQSQAVTVDYMDQSAERNKRKAIVHTIEIAEKHSRRAQEVVSGFRHGLYARNVDFHVGRIEDFLERRYTMDKGTNPFLTHAILDLPGPDYYLAPIADALKTDGTLVVFNPSVTQITSCVQKVSEKGIPLQLEQVLELGGGMSGGKEWDVRIARIRAAKATSRGAQPIDNETSDESAARTSEPLSPTSEEADGAVAVAQAETASESESDVISSRPASGSRAEEQGWAMVCRPKAGKMIQGGGFLGVWRKKQVS